MYYSHPILNVLANEFKISDERASLVPTIMQGGYACGLLFVIPLGDVLPRRPFVIALMTVTAVLVSTQTPPSIYNMLPRII